MNLRPVSSGEESDHFLSGRPRTQSTDRAPFYGVISVGLPKAAFRHTVDETVGSLTWSLGNPRAVDSRDGWRFDSFLPHIVSRESSSAVERSADDVLKAEKSVVQIHPLSQARRCVQALRKRFLGCRAEVASPIPNALAWSRQHGTTGRVAQLVEHQPRVQAQSRGSLVRIQPLPFWDSSLTVARTLGATCHGIACGSHRKHSEGRKFETFLSHFYGGVAQ